MEKRKLAPVVAVAVCFLFALCSFAWAGTEPSPFQPEINNLHSMELNIATIYKRLGELLDSPASPIGVTGQLEAMANKLGDLDTRLADVLNVLPTPSIPPYDGKDEVLSALDGIRSDSGRIVFLATHIAVEAFLWQPAALSVKNNAQAIINRIDAYICPIGIDCRPSSEQCVTYSGSLDPSAESIYHDLGSVSDAVITGDLICPSNTDKRDFDLYLEVEINMDHWITVASSLGVPCTESVSYDVGSGSYNELPFRWRVFRYDGEGSYSLFSCID